MAVATEVFGTYDFGLSVTRNSVYHALIHPSRLLAPVVPRAAPVG